MAVQKNLRKLLGYEIDIKTEKIYPFEESDVVSGYDSQEKQGLDLT